MLPHPTGLNRALEHYGLAAGNVERLLAAHSSHEAARSQAASTCPAATWSRSHVPAAVMGRLEVASEHVASPAGET
jgi:hypothetical protein